MQYILTLDQGTTSSRAILFDHAGEIRSIAQQEFTQIFPKPGFIEHNPEEIWQTQIDVARQCLEKAGITAKDIAGLGITNQRETTVIWNRSTGKPIYNAIVWQDRRTADLCQQLQEAGYDPLFRQRTGLRLDPYFSATKIHWILNNVPNARKLAQQGELAFGTIDSWLVWKLTGGKCHLIEISNASRTLLFDIHRGLWDEQLLALLDIPPNILPQVCSSSEIYADTAEGIFPSPIPIAGIAGDQQAALFGQRCTKPGMSKTTYGTGCFMLLNTGSKPIASTSDLLTTIAWKINGQVSYALEGSVFIAGAAVQWLRDGLKLIKTSAEIETLARTVPDNGGVYLVPAFAGLGAPHWDPYARGTIVGITRGTNAGHFARAALEAIAFQTADLLRAMEQDAGAPISEVRVDGAATENKLLMQFQADISRIVVKRPKIWEITALGAAYLAGLAVGYWKDQNELDAHWKVEQEYKPAMELKLADQLQYNWQRAIERSEHWIEGDI